MRKFTVTYENWTEEDAIFGETDDKGVLDADLSLGQAVYAVNMTDDNHSSVECVEASCSDHKQARWITVHNSPSWTTGITEQRSLHIPEGVTPSSRARIVRAVLSGKV